MRLYDSTVPSGNAYKVSLLLSHLDLPHDVVSLDTLASPSETRQPVFLAKNPNGRIPVLEFDDGRCLAESGAILWYLADSTDYLAADPFERAQTLQWLFFEQYSHEPFIAVLKFWTYWGGLDKLSSERLSTLRERGQQALDVLEGALRDRDFLVAQRYSIADMALYAYTQAAADIGYQVGENIRAWITRIVAQPGYAPIKPDPLGKAPRAAVPGGHG